MEKNMNSANVIESNIPARKRDTFRVFTNNQIDISNLLPSMEEQAFLRDVGEIAEDLGIDKNMLKAKMAELLKKKNYKIRVMSILEKQVAEKPRRKINFIPMTREEIDATDPVIKCAIEKLMEEKGKIEYQKARGRAAKPLTEWLEENLIKTNILTPEELSVLPMNVFQRFDPNLARAFHNAKYRKAAK
jgi:hypothetical protein